MRWGAWFVVVVSLASAASADYTLVANKNTLTVKNGKRSAPLRSNVFEVSDVKVDTKAKTVTAELQGECLEESATWTFDQLEARLANADALVLHRKKQWAKAAPGFETAAKLDPKWNLAAYNLASARARLADQTAAVAALAPWLASAPIETYLQVSTDPELQPLLAHADLAKVRATKPGTMKVVKNRVEGRFGISTERGLVAAEVVESDGMSCVSVIRVVFLDIKTGKVAGAIPLATQGDNNNCNSKKTKPFAKDREAVVGKLLVDLGFTPTPFEFGESAPTKSGNRGVSFKEAKLGVVSNDNDTINVLRQDTQVATGTSSLSRLIYAAYVPAAKLVIAGTHRPSDMCPDNAVDGIVVP
jgi:hypothetical protein